MLLSLLFSNPLAFILVAAVLVFSLSVHEFAHAFVADKLGDPTARYLGRLTIDPRAHLDLLGTVLLLTVGFGWGKPVPFNPNNLKNPKRDSAMIAFAGPFSNFVLAFLFGFLIHFLPSISVFRELFFLTVFYNLVLGFFNLIPVNPLDGFKVVYGLLPYNLAAQWLQTGSYGIYILLFLIATRATNMILDPLVTFVLRILRLSSS